MPHIDSHLHLSDYADARGALKFAMSSETLLFACSTGRENSMLTLQFAHENGKYVRSFVGVHPSEASREPELSWLASVVGEAAGVGEIGLDPKYSDLTERAPQTRVFEEQLSLAQRNRKPVQIHSRDAEAKCMAKLAAFDLRAVLLHWFEGESLARGAADRGYFVSFGPALLHSKKLQRIATAYHEDLLLSESDGPVGFSSIGGAGGPWLVPSVVIKLAQLRRKPFEEMARILVGNGMAYLGGPRKG